ncbi:uncharacterized protein LOC111210435 isoform X2 [Brassica napus]|uniref:uncharacterized protein LOC111210435 isoform X2 n=1 Tax=Brassica napus TaxID=3708 RepID=UPI0020790367|nr:uncharacterized protein LOC111210435 isoform X2 [Brassica napus]
MEEPGHETGIPGRRQSDLKQSFRKAVRYLLTACSREDFLEIFSKFDVAEQNRLYWLTTQGEFDAQCQAFQVGPILDKVEQMVEEQSLDPLCSDKSNVMDLANDLTTAKKSEIQRLTALIQRAEEHNRQMEARIRLLREQPQEASDTTNAIKKLKTGITAYFEGNDKLPPI